MKQILQSLYKERRRDYFVWSYLWIFSDKNTIEFTNKQLCQEFDLPASTLHRIIHGNIDIFNDVKTYVEYEKTSRVNHKIIFHPTGKKEKKVKSKELYDELYNWMEEYYKSIDFDYTDIKKHKKYIRIIALKIKEAMKEKDTAVTDDSLRDTFKFFIQNIDEWWVNSGNITLPLISKHFTKLLNQVKTNGTRSKSDKYSKAAKQADEIDFGKFTRKE